MYTRKVQIMNYLTFLCIFILALALSCQSPTYKEGDAFENKLEVTYKNGIHIQFNTNKDVYSLDDSVEINYKAKNRSENNSVKTKECVGRFNLNIENESGKLVQLLPYGHRRAYCNNVYEPGDSTIMQVYWDQKTRFGGPAKNLKAYSGKYKLQFVAYPFMQEWMIKWIEITEKGEPLSTKLYRHFGRDDSLIINFLVRNRISKPYTLTPSQKDSIRVQFLDIYTNDLKHELRWPLTFKTIQIEPKSDLYLFIYKQAYKELVKQGLAGIYNCTITIPTQKKALVASERVFIKTNAP